VISGLKNITSSMLLTMGLIIAGLLGSCSRIDTPPMLKIKVSDINGQPVGKAMVGLFPDLDEWSMLENPVQPWKETADDGTVVFNSLEEDIYYFYIDADSLSNLSTTIKLDESLKYNEIRVISVRVE
jgi:hypothetical protein